MTQHPLTPKHPLLQQAAELCRTGHFAAALAIYRQLLVHYPRHPELLNTLGKVALQAGHGAAGVDYCEQALRLDPGQATSWFYLGIGRKQLGQHAASLQAFDRAIARQPGFAEAWCNKGNVLQELKRFAEAVDCFEQAIRLRAEYPLAFYNMGVALRQLQRHADAAAAYRRALALQPGFAEAWCHLGNALLDLEQTGEALASYARALALRPGLALAWYQQGLAQFKLRDYRAAQQSFERALALEPDFEFLRGQLLYTRAHLCDWRELDAAVAALRTDIGGGRRASFPFAVQLCCDDPALQRQAAETWSRARCPARQDLPAPAVHPGHARLRIGYFSADLRDHPVAQLSARLFELHDRAQFEIFAFSYGPNPAQDPLRRRLEQAFDHFLDITGLSDLEAAQRARELEIDIAVDLGGHTSGNRNGIFALRAAAVQVSYLGFSGTLGTDYMDYLLADPVVIPAASRQHYAEKIAYLPDCYLVTDDTRPIAAPECRRDAFGLPATGFVFCCFNNAAKIGPETFGCWMRILAGVAGSVLWLSVAGDAARANLRQAAQHHGIAPERLVFAERVPDPAEHLARLRLADLFLDTLPYNAHTTCADALWAGLPVLTRAGAGFAGRVAASLLTALQLPELIADGAEAYAARAVALAQDPAQLAALRERLAASRQGPPFDTRRFARQLETLYLRMQQRALAGQAPAHLPP